LLTDNNTHFLSGSGNANGHQANATACRPIGLLGLLAKGKTVPAHAVKVYVGIEVYPFILNLGNRCKGAVTFTHRPLLPFGPESGTH
jgi:hypothetical protein